MDRFANPGAARWVGESIPVLDHGSVKLVDYMGNDATICAAARHSYGKSVDESDVEGNTKLINYLMKHQHTSPFEQPALTFELQLPLFVQAQLVRHRTAKLNIFSGRYAEMKELFYVPAPDRVQAQSKSNKQGSGEALLPEQVHQFTSIVKFLSKWAFDEYHHAINELGVSRELARIILPVNTYSKMVWQSDLSNLLKFLTLRGADSAQWEIRQYAERIAAIVAEAFPITYAAWCKHQASVGLESFIQRVKDKQTWH